MIKFPEDILEQKVVTAYTRGDCWVLAGELLRRGYPLAIAVFSIRQEFWAHAANRLPDGRVLDVEGVWDETEWITRWNRTLVPEERKSGDLIALEWSAAKFAKEVQRIGGTKIFEESDDVVSHADILLKNL